MSAAVSGNGASSLSAAYTLLALDAFAKTRRRRRRRSASARSARTAASAPLTLPAGAMPKVAHRRRPRRRCSSPSRGPLPAYYVVNESGFDRNPPAAEVSQGVEIIREFVDAKGNAADARDGRRGVLRPAARARDRPRSAAADRHRRSAAGRRRAGAGAAAAGRLAARPASIRRWRGSAARPASLPDRRARTSRTGCRVTSTCARTASCSMATSPGTSGTFVYRVRATNAGIVPGAAGVCRRDVQPHGRRPEQGRHAGDREAMTGVARCVRWLLRPRRSCAVALVAAARLAARAAAPSASPLSTGVWSADGELLRVTPLGRRSVPAVGAARRRCRPRSSTPSC